MVAPLKVSHLVNSNFSQKETQLPAPRSLVTCWLDVSFQAFLSARGDCECADTPDQGHRKDKARSAQERSHAAQEEAAHVGCEPGWKHLCQVLTSGYLKQNEMSMSWPRSSPFHPYAQFPWWLHWAFLNEKKKKRPIGCSWMVMRNWVRRRCDGIRGQLESTAFLCLFVCLFKLLRTRLCCL